MTEIYIPYLDEQARRVIRSFIVDTDALYHSVQTHAGNIIDPPEYMDYCKICGAQEREHLPGCILYSLFMAM